MFAKFATAKIAKDLIQLKVSTNCSAYCHKTTGMTSNIEFNGSPVWDL